MVAMIVGEICDVSQELFGMVKPALDAGDFVATSKTRSGQETNQCKEGTRLPFWDHRQVACAGRLNFENAAKFKTGFDGGARVQ